MKSRLAVMVAAVVLLAAPAGAGEVAVEDLHADPGAHDVAVRGEVTVVGELVLDFQRRGRWVWSQLNDDGYVAAPLREHGLRFGGNFGIGVRFSAAAFDAAGFEHPGGYRYRGPVVRATGAWRFRDETRGGESYLAVTRFEVVEPEQRLEEEVPFAVLVAGLVLLGIGLGVPRMRRKGS